MQNPEPPDSPTIEPVLPPETVDWLFERLGVRYGHFFLGRWAGIELSNVKQDWAYELRYVTDAQLQFGVQNLPSGSPPDVGQFRAICRSMPDPQRRKLPHRPEPGIPANVRAALQALAELSEDERPQRVRWAEAYVGKWGTAIHLTPFQKDALAHARAVLRRWEAGGFEDPQAARAAADARAAAAARNGDGHAVPPSTTAAAQS